jgi:hypothetical protein
MRQIILLSLFITGCPKSTKNFDEKEREENLKELMENEDLFEDLPESILNTEEDEGKDDE